jgi:hypothetical protein
MLLAGLMATACNKEDETPNPFEGTGNHITSFVITKGDVSYTAAVAAGTITVTVPENVSLDGATATYELCENATIAPDPATITNWDSEQQFAVTAYNGTKTTYKYTVEHSGIIHNGTVILKTQAEVDAFGQGEYSIIDGYLTIGTGISTDPGVDSGTDTITSLAPLAGLKAVTGSITINDTYKGDLTAFEQLETLGGLLVQSRTVRTVRFPKLTAIRSDLNINAALLVDALDFPELTVIEKGLRIYRTSSLATVNFPKLQRVTEGVAIEGSSASDIMNLQTIAFPELTALGGEIKFTGIGGVQSISVGKLETASAVRVSTNALTNFNFPALTTVTGDLAITSTQLTELQLPALTTVEVSLALTLPALTSLELPLLKKVGTFAATDLRALATLDVRNIEEIGTLNLGSNTLRYTQGIKLIGHETFSGRLLLGLSNIGTAMDEFPLTVEGIKVVGGLEHVPSMNGASVKAIDFPWLERITGLLSIGYSTQLTTIKLPNLQSVGGFSLGMLAVLTTIDLPNLETITGYTSGTVTGGGFTYALTSTALTTVALPKLKSVTGNISITGLLAARPLATISFPELTNLTGTLTITGTNSTTFTDLSGFSKLTSATGVTISGFTQLKNFEPLKNVILSLTAATWKISGCGYNPTYQNMLDGSYTN